MKCLKCYYELTYIDGYFCAGCGSTSINKDYYRFSLCRDNLYYHITAGTYSTPYTSLDIQYDGEIQFKFFIEPDIKNFLEFANNLLDRLLKLKSFV